MAKRDDKLKSSDIVDVSYKCIENDLSTLFKLGFINIRNMLKNLGFSLLFLV